MLLIIMVAIIILSNRVSKFFTLNNNSVQPLFLLANKSRVPFEHLLLLLTALFFLIIPFTLKLLYSTILLQLLLLVLLLNFMFAFTIVIVGVILTGVEVLVLEGTVDVLRLEGQQAA